MKLIYADRWIIDAVKSTNETLTTLLDIPKLYNTLSVEDVAFYIYINKRLSDYLPKAIANSFTPVDFDFSAYDLEVQPLLTKVTDKLEALEMRQRQPKLADTRRKNKALTCDLIDDEHIVFYHHDEIVHDKSADMLKLVDRCMRQMYTSLKFEQLIKLPISKLYMELKSESFA